MAQIIMMARSYRKKPSEILGIKDEYTAFCLDEAAYMMEAEVIDKKGEYKWNKLKWKSDKPKSNKDLINFINKHK